MRAALLIAAKDIRQRLRDRSAFVVAIVLPLVLAAIFALTFHDVSGGKVSFAYGLVDLDGGPAARAFERGALRPLERRGLFSLRKERTPSAARHALDRGTLSAAFVVPSGFSAAVAERRPAELRVLGNPDARIGTQVAQSIAQTYASRLEAGRAAPVSVVDVATTDRQLAPATMYSAGMAVFFLFLTVPFGITSLLVERREGTLARILAAPVHPGAVLAGKLLTSVVAGVASMAVLALATHFLLGAEWGAPVGLAILIVAGVLAATGVTALVAAFARTPDQAQAWQFTVSLVLGMLGGSFFPVARAGDLLRALNLATPQAWFLRGVEELAGGAGAGVAAGPVLALLAFALVTGTVAALRAGSLAA